MKKLSVLLICVCTLVSCGNGGISHNSIEKKKYDIENAVDGKYTVVYTETSALLDDLLDIKIKKDDDVIFTFGTDVKGQYKLPEKVAYLFDYDGEKIYYVQNYTRESVGMTKYEPFCWLSCSNEKRCFDFNNNPKHVAMDYVSINISDSDSEYEQEELVYVSEFLQENITEQGIVDIFDKCGYDSTYILEIYNYKRRN
ncbi:MAG: hypothetical protein K2J47_06655 [Ruminococcus sp.]|nr:hypothetical protein [Ruminococcus sp.]MDE6788985.1 hypothetical protein [Ruminococcus sp.]